MTTLFVRHDVADYATWRALYDDFDATRSAMGVTSASVYRAADDPNNLTVTHDFATIEAAQAFAGSPELKDVMSRAGVVGAPDIWFTNPA